MFELMIGESGSSLCASSISVFRETKLAHLHQVRGVPLMRSRVFRIQLQRLLKITLRAEPVPVVSEFDECSRRVSFGKRRISIDRFLCRRFCFRHFIHRP